MIEIVLVYNVDREQIRNSAANRLIGEVVQSRRRLLLGPSPGLKRSLVPFIFENIYILQFDFLGMVVNIKKHPETP